MNWKPLEPTLHRLMGVRGMSAFIEREIRQLPPENDQCPELIVHLGRGEIMTVDEFSASKYTFAGGEWRIYWAAPRVMDTLVDIQDAARGFDRTRRWAFFIGLLAGVLIGFPVGAFLTKGLL